MAVLSTAVWRVRPGGSNINGGGYDPGIAGAGTDYSQQNAAQATGTVGTAAGTTTFTDAAGLFTAAMIGNALWIASGAGFTVGVYFITARASSTSITLDRSPGTGSAAQWKVGGAWANFWTNTTANIVPGNIVYILGGGTPNPASYSFDYTASAGFSPVNGNVSAGFIRFVNDPSTPGFKAPPDTTGGMPCISFTPGAFINPPGYNSFEGLWFVSGAGGIGLLANLNFRTKLLGCILDQNGFSTYLVNAANALSMFGCEIFSSSSASGGYAVLLGGAYLNILSCNIHNTTGPGVILDQGSILANTILSKCAGDALELRDNGSGIPTVIMNNTIDGNTGNGIIVDTTQVLAFTPIMNNILSNHTGVGKNGLTISAGTTAANDRVKKFVDYNVYYNNTADINAISYGPHDTHGGSNPYVGQSTENYTLA